MRKNNLIDEQINKILIDVFADKIQDTNTKKKNFNISKIIDSFSAVELILNLEEKFDVKINIENIELIKLSSTKSIKNLILQNKK